MKNEVKYFEYGDEYFAAVDKESCIKFISEFEDEEPEEIAEIVKQVSKDLKLDSFLLENIESVGFSSAVYVEFHNVSLEEIYTLIYKAGGDGELPLQLVFEGY